LEIIKVHLEDLKSGLKDETVFLPVSKVGLKTQTGV